MNSAQIDRAVQELIAEAVEFAKESPWPDAATATDHVFSEDVTVLRD